MKLKTLAAAAVMGMALSGGAGADEITLYDEQPDVSNLFNKDTVAYTISINYDPSLWESVTSAILQIKLTDDASDPGDQDEKGQLSGFTTWVDVTGGYFGSYDVTGLLNTALQTASGPSTFNIEFFSQQTGDFLYNNAKLVVNFVAVPEASELLLMGAGLVAVGAFARKRRAGAHWA